MKNSVCARWIVVLLLIMSQTVLAANMSWGSCFFKAKENPLVVEPTRRRKILLSWIDNQGEKQSAMLSGQEISDRQLLQNAITIRTGIPVGNQKLKRVLVEVPWSAHALDFVQDTIGLSVSRKPVLEIVEMT